MKTTELARVRELAASDTARAIRRLNRLSLNEVAVEVGVAISTVWRWENGQRRPHGEAAIRYGRLLDELMRD